MRIDARGKPWVGFLAAGLLAFSIAGCATPRIDWAARLGAYSYDQAVTELGPPDKSAKLSNGTTISEWLHRRGNYYAYPAYAAYPWGWGSMYPTYIDTYRYPDQFLRLTFDTNGVLTAWKQVYK